MSIDTNITGGQYHQPPPPPPAPGGPTPADKPKDLGSTQNLATTTHEHIAVESRTVDTKEAYDPALQTAIAALAAGNAIPLTLILEPPKSKGKEGDKQSISGAQADKHASATGQQASALITHDEALQALLSDTLKKAMKQMTPDEQKKLVTSLEMMFEKTKNDIISYLFETSAKVIRENDERSQVASKEHNKRDSERKQNDIRQDSIESDRDAYDRHKSGRT